MNDQNTEKESKRETGRERQSCLLHKHQQCPVLKKKRRHRGRQAEAKVFLRSEKAVFWAATNITSCGF